MPTHEERVETSRTVSEARAEREAIQAVERETDAEYRRLLDGGINPMAGASCPWPASADFARLMRSARESVRAGAIPAMYAELRERMGPPAPPIVNTGWYRCGDDWCRIGTWPYPEYRYPGLAWKLRWTAPKPDDVPWEDEAAPEPEAAAEVDAPAADDRRGREPTAAREPVGARDQLRFGW